MIIKVLTGFLTGVAATIIFWCFLGPAADNGLKQTVPVQVPPAVESSIKKNEEAPEWPLLPTAQQETTTEASGNATRIKAISEPKTKLPDDLSSPPAVVPVSSSEDASRITTTKSSLQNLTTQKQTFDSAPAMSTAADLAPTFPVEDGQNHETPADQKFFFWSPFSLNSKAERFANHVKSICGVKCGVEKTGAGRYQVYFPFEDESDRNEKLALIKATGLKF